MKTNPNRLEMPYVNDIGQTLEVGCNVVTFTGHYRSTCVKRGKFLGVKMETNEFDYRFGQIVGIFVEREDGRSSMMGNCKAYLENTPLSELDGKFF